MKIAIIHNQFSRGGGMEAYMLSLVKGFIKAEDQVTLIVYEADKQLAAKFPCNIIRLSLPPLPGKWKKYLFIRKCNRLFDAHKYDISISLTRTSCQDIAVCGGVHPEVVKRVKRSSLLRHLHDRFEIAFEEKMLQKVPLIMAHSAVVAQELLANYQFDKNKLLTFFPPIDTETYSPATSDEINQTVQHYGISSDKLTFLFPSCGHQCKGLKPLLEAFSKLDPNKFELLVAGASIPARHPLNVRHIGYVDNLAPLYSSIDYTILPSNYEAFGLVIPESLQCRTPVITTKAVGAAELLSADDGIILEDNNPETIIAALSGLEGRVFQVSKNFAERHRLTIDQHIAEIKALAPISRLQEK